MTGRNISGSESPIHSSCRGFVIQSVERSGPRKNLLEKQIARLRASAEQAERLKECDRERFFRPFGAESFPNWHPGLASWAVFLRCFAAGNCDSPVLIRILSSHADSESRKLRMIF